ncbi:hypothetical protein ILUMI_18062, partial [Ignelater luminosus]
MTYGLLSLRVHKRLSLDSVQTFDELLTRARGIEETLVEEMQSKIKPKHKERQIENSVNRTERPKCRYCKNFGHTIEQCRKLSKSNDNVPTDAVRIEAKAERVEKSDTQKKATFSCFGCGAPGVIKSACSKCKSSSTNNKETSVSTIDIFSFDLEQFLRPRERPVLLVDVNGCVGYGLIDIGGRQSIAGYRLYQMLLEKKQSFEQKEVSVILADGKIRSKEVLYTTVNVKMQGGVVPTTFIAFPDSVKSRTLLGIDFIKDAKIVIDVDGKSWHFSDETDNVFELQFEDSIGKKDVKSAQVCVEEVLRVDEGQMLTSDQKDALGKLLNKIDTGDHTPVSSSPYPMPNHKKEILRKEIDEMLSSE